MSDFIPLKVDAAIGSALVTTPIWNYYLQCVNEVASVVAALCGAIVGLHAVYRIWEKHYRKAKPHARYTAD